MRRRRAGDQSRTHSPYPKGIVSINPNWTDMARKMRIETNLASRSTRIISEFRAIDVFQITLFIRWAELLPYFSLV